MITDEHLLAEWNRARGKNAPPVKPEEEALIIAGLRDRAERLKNPPPLEFCAACGVKARGLHRSRTAQ